MPYIQCPGHLLRIAWHRGLQYSMDVVQLYPGIGHACCMSSQYVTACNRGYADVQLGGKFTSTKLRLMLLSLLCQSSGMDRNVVNEIHNEFQPYWQYAGRRIALKAVLYCITIITQFYEVQKLPVLNNKPRHNGFTTPCPILHTAFPCLLLLKTVGTCTNTSVTCDHPA